MPIPLFSIPSHIQDSIIQKLDLADFIQFHRSSQKSFVVAKNVKTRFTMESKKSILLKLFYSNEEMSIKLYKSGKLTELILGNRFYDVPVRFDECDVQILGTFSYDLCISFIKFLEYTNSSVFSITCRKVCISPETLHRLIEIGKVEQMFISGPLPSPFMEIEAIQDISSFYITFMEESEILLLKAIDFTIESTNLTSVGINLFLKELLSGRRRIKVCCMRTNNQIVSDVALEGIQASLVPSHFYPSLSGEIFRVGTKPNIRLISFDHKTFRVFPECLLY